MMMPDALATLPLSDVLGVMGACFYMLNFTLLTLRMQVAQDWTYMILNLAAASLVIVSLWGAFNAAAMAIQCFWVLVTLLGMGLRIRRDRHRAPRRTAAAAALATVQAAGAAGGRA